MALRIGFAFNEKPSEEEEPPSSRSHDRLAEWDDPRTIAAVAEALGRAGTVIPLEADEEFPQRLRESKPDIVFNIAEGLHGPNREAHVPAICEYFGVPYTGSDPLTLALGLDKERTKEVLAARGVPTPRWTVAGHGAGPSHLDGLSYPLFVKPLYEGSSKGIDVGSLCGTRDAAEARVRWVEENYAQPALVEEFLTGREFTVAILGNGDGARAFPPVEISFDSLPRGAPPVYGWEAKWVWDTPEKPLSIFQC
ncbi:MAG: D-alanine--D-alanine ligase family protein, partial [Longimicrobiales bacterium]